LLSSDFLLNYYSEFLSNGVIVMSTRIDIDAEVRKWTRFKATAAAKPATQ